MSVCTMEKGKRKIARGLSTERYNKVSLLFVTTLGMGHPPKDSNGDCYKQGDRYGRRRNDNQLDKSEIWL